MKSDFLKAFATALAAMALCGCVGYRVGSLLPEGIHSVRVPTFVNRTTEPLLELDTTQAAIRELQKDGSLEVAKSDTADAILEVTLTDYALTPLSYDQEKKTKANEYRMTLTAAVVLRKAGSGDILVESPRVQGEATFFVAGDLTSSKKNALPVAARDLAHDIVEKVVESW
jgi:hypothetical protein